MEDIRHIVWDWNGTLLDDVAACVEAINRMIAVRGLRPLDETRYRDLFQFPVRNYYAELGFDLEREDWDAMAREFHAHYHDTAGSTRLRDGVTDVLQAFRDRGVAMSILSACEITILRNMLAARGIAHFFQHVRGLADLHAASKLELGRRLLADLALRPEQVLLIGDTTHDHDVAEALGCRCLLVAGGHQSAERLTGSARAMRTGIRDLLALIAALPPPAAA